MANLTCTENIIGITRLDCECYPSPSGENPIDIDYNVSASGLYLDELEGVAGMGRVSDSMSCDEELAQFYLDGRESAIMKVTDEVLKQINGRFVKQDRTFIGNLGAKAFNRNVDISSDEFYGMYLRMVEIQDGVMVLNGIQTMFGSDAVIDVLIYRYYYYAEMYELVDTIEGVVCTANRLVSNAIEVPINLPMYDATDGRLDYFIVYRSAGGLTPKNNLPTCGGCGRIENKALQYVYKTGVHGTGLDNIANWDKTSANAYGLSLQVEFRCDADAIICKMFDTLSEWKKQFAYAVLLRAGIIVNNKVLTSPEVSRAQMIDRDSLVASMGIWENDLISIITWLAQNVNPNVNDCYMCDNANLKVSPILL